MMIIPDSIQDSYDWFIQYCAKLYYHAEKLSRYIMFILNSIRKSIRAKFMATFTIILITLSIISLYNNYSDQKIDGMDFAENHIETLAEMLVFSVGAGISESNFDIVQTAFSWAKKDKDIIYIDIVDETNSSLVTYNPNNLTIDSKEIGSDAKINAAANYLAINVPIIYKDKNHGNIILAYSLEQMNEKLSEHAYEFILTSMVIFVFGLAGVFIISNMLTGKLKFLKDSAVKVGNGDLNVNIDIKSRDEIGSLAKALSTMITNIKLASDSLNDEKLKAETAMKEAEMQKNMMADQKDYLSKKISFILEEMNKFSEGDLTIKLEVDKEDEIGNLYAGFNSVVANIREIIITTSEAVQATASASNQISSSAEEMAAGSQEQSAQTTEVASAVEQMTNTILQTTKNAGSAAEFSKKAGQSAINGGEVVKQTVEGMNRIAKVVGDASTIVKELGKSSNQIGEIIQVIDDIADQTNLLALNAAIEAARAGEQGRGFAVVADEVRKLAERTTKATKEIAAMIKQIQKDTGNAVVSIESGTKEVEVGKEFANKAIGALDEIISSTNQTIDVISQVAAASEEQSSAAEQISKSIEGISSITQESAAGTQQIARAAEDLNRLTENLQNLISRFKVDDHQTKRLSVRSNEKLIHS